jgi:hypothetical protein
MGPVGYIIVLRIGRVSVAIRRLTAGIDQLERFSWTGTSYIGRDGSACPVPLIEFTECFSCVQFVLFFFGVWGRQNSETRWVGSLLISICACARYL